MKTAKRSDTRHMQSASVRKRRNAAIAAAAALKKKFGVETIKEARAILANGGAPQPRPTPTPMRAVTRPVTPRRSGLVQPEPTVTMTVNALVALMERTRRG